MHEKRRKCNNEAIENDFVKSYLVATTAIINDKTPGKPRSEAVDQRSFVKKVFLNFVKFSKTPFFMEHFQWLLLPAQETETEQLESCVEGKFIRTGLIIILKRNYLSFIF